MRPSSPDQGLGRQAISIAGDLKTALRPSQRPVSSRSDPTRGSLTKRRWERHTTVAELSTVHGSGSTPDRRAIGASRPTVIRWRARYAQGGLDTLLDRHRSGRPRENRDDNMRLDIVARTLAGPLKRLDVPTGPRACSPHGWAFTVSRIWRYRLKPHRTQTFKFSTDPELVERIRDIVGLYLNPPEQAVMLWVDGKSQIQVLDRTAPILPLRSGCRRRPLSTTFGNGTATLFARSRSPWEGHRGVLERHRHQEFLRFLKGSPKAYPRGTCTSCSTTTGPTPTRS